MREIQVDMDVFSKIWSHRIAGEASENEVLRRLLLASDSPTLNTARMPKLTSNVGHLELNSSETGGIEESGQTENAMGKIRWVDDVYAALKALGGSASLHQIYRAVGARRREGGRTLPRTVEAIIRRTLEDHSSDSANFKSDNLFRLLGRGEWGLR